MKILVVDDEQLVRWFMDRALKKGGHEVITAAGADEAIEYINSQTVDLLLVDLRMPEVSGAELIDRVVRLPKRPKIIVCSAFITPEMETDFTNEGIHVLKKPFKLSELNDTLKRCLEGPPLPAA
jgi:DNA-binding NtrC family response regulator